MPKTKKTKNNKKKAGPAKQQTKQAPNRKQTRVGQLRVPPKGLVATVCSITNPFCPEANGSKYPDKTAVKSLAYQLHVSRTLTTDINGHAGLLLCPGYTYLFADAATFSGTASTYGNFAASPNTPAAGGYRIVSWGFKLSNTCTPMTSSGLVNVRSFSVINGLTLGGLDSASYNANQCLDVPLQNCSEVVVFGRPIDESSHNIFSPPLTNPSVAVNAWVSPGWEPILVALHGGPNSTSCMEIEVIINYELTFADSDSMALFSTPPPAPNTIATDISSAIRRTSNTIFKNGMKDAETFVVNAAQHYARQVMVEGAMAALLM